MSGYTCGPAFKWIHAWRGDLHACLRSDAEPLGFRQRAVPTDAAAFDARELGGRYRALRERVPCRSRYLPNK